MPLAQAAAGAHLSVGMARSRKMTATVAPRKKPATTSAGWCRLSTMRDPPIAHDRPTCARMVLGSLALEFETSLHAHPSWMIFSSLTRDAIAAGWSG